MWTAQSNGENNIMDLSAQHGGNNIMDRSTMERRILWNPPRNPVANLIDFFYAIFLASPVTQGAKILLYSSPDHVPIFFMDLSSHSTIDSSFQPWSRESYGLLPLTMQQRIL